MMCIGVDCEGCVCTRSHKSDRSAFIMDSPLKIPEIVCSKQNWSLNKRYHS
jgi:hypothetical protein